MNYRPFRITQLIYEFITMRYPKSIIRKEEENLLIFNFYIILSIISYFHFSENQSHKINFFFTEFNLKFSKIIVFL